MQTELQGPSTGTFYRATGIGKEGAGQSQGAAGRAPPGRSQGRPGEKALSTVLTAPQEADVSTRGCVLTQNEQLRGGAEDQTGSHVVWCEQDPRLEGGGGRGQVLRGPWRRLVCSVAYRLLGRNTQ